jgi:hypothetical protein
MHLTAIDLTLSSLRRKTFQGEQNMSLTETQQIEAVITHHLQAVTGGTGMDEILKDYTDESFILTPEKPFRGLNEIRIFFEAFVAGLTPEVLGNLQVKRLDFVGEVAYIVFSATPLTSLGTDTFIVRNGKIVAQTFTILG